MKMFANVRLRAIALLAFAVVAGSALGQATTTDPAQREFAQKVVAASGLYNSGKVDEALREFEALYASNPESVDVQAWLGFLYLKTNQHSKAVPVLEKAAAARPDSPDIAMNLGNAYMSTGMNDKALAQFEKVAQLQPERFEAVYNLGVLHLNKDNAKAAEYLTKATEISPDNAVAHNNLGLAYEGQKMSDKAAASFAKASDLDKDSPVYAKNAGFAYVRARNQGAAITFLERAKTLDSADNDVKVALAEMYMRSGRKPDAIGMYAELEPVMGTNANYWYNMGVVKSDMGDREGAEAAFRKSLAIEDDLETRNNLGLLLFERGEYAESRDMFKGAMTISPNNIGVQLNYAAASLKAGDLPTAVDIWKRVIRSNPERNDVRLQLANALWQTDDRAGAGYHYRQVLARDRANAEALNGAGLVHLTEDRLGEAESAFRSAIASNGKLVPAYNNLAIALERQNKKAEAIKVLERALQIDPDNADIQDNLKRMKA
jgi:tetratricopeptide (TPR) repeat protein